MNHNRYRFFISYCSEDEAIAKLVVATLAKAGHHIMEMSQAQPGIPYADEIRRWINGSHFVIPIVTEQSKTRPWVHQEIGYALGRHLPVVPIMFRCDPGSLAFLDTVRATIVNNELDLETELQKINWRGIISENKERSPYPVSTFDGDATFRAKLLAEAARKININFPEADLLIRQCSRLTSFSLPRDHGVGPWTVVNSRNDIFWLQTEEREALQKIADQGRCDLRIDPDYYEYSDGRRRLFQVVKGKRKDVRREVYDPRIQLARLETLCVFLNAMDDTKVRVVVDDEFASSDSITIIGDHWLAFSAAVAPFAKHRKTIWTWHAPTVAWECENFDKNFEADLNEQQSRIGKISPRAYAIERINRAATEIRREFNL